MTVIIMRGVPGSGKSTLAKKLFAHPRIHSADDFFMENGEYKFDPSKLGLAHSDCFSKFMASIQNASTHAEIVVDNTNTQLWELSPYRAVAHHFNHGIRFIRAECNPEIAATRNVHGVPKGAIMAMHKRMESIPPFWGKEEVVLTD